MGHDWRTAIDMSDWMRDQERRTSQTERRPVPGLQTPATFARSAVRVVDWNLAPATINGYFYSDDTAFNSPVNGDSWIGTTTVDPAGFGVQTVWRYQGDDLAQYSRQFTSFTGTPLFEPWENIYPGTDGVWVDALPILSMPNVNLSIAYARYMRVGNTLTYQGSIQIQTGGVAGQVLIDLPAGMDWGAGMPYLISIGWTEILPIGKVRALRSGVSWYEGDIIPYSMKAGATPARASVWQPGVAAASDGSSSGAVWQPTVPVAGNFQAGDKWGWSFTAEIAP